MKKNYEELVLEIIKFTDEDVLTVSGFLGGKDEFDYVQNNDPLGSLEL